MTTPATLASRRPPATAPGGPVIANELRVVDWLDPGMIEFGACPDLTTARTVADAAGVVRELLNGLADSDDFLPAVFLGADGQFFTVEVDVVVRRADPAEIRKAAERELEDIKDMRGREAEPALGEGEEEDAERAEFLAERVETLNSYLARAAG